MFLRQETVHWKGFTQTQRQYESAIQLKKEKNKTQL